MLGRVCVFVCLGALPEERLCMHCADRRRACRRASLRMTSFAFQESVNHWAGRGACMLGEAFAPVWLAAPSSRRPSPNDLGFADRFLRFCGPSAEQQQRSIIPNHGYNILQCKVGEHTFTPMVCLRTSGRHSGGSCIDSNRKYDGASRANA